MTADEVPDPLSQVKSLFDSVEILALYPNSGVVETLKVLRTLGKAVHEDLSDADEFEKYIRTVFSNSKNIEDVFTMLVFEHILAMLVIDHKVVAEEAEEMAQFLASSPVLKLRNALYLADTRRKEEE